MKAILVLLVIIIFLVVVYAATLMLGVPRANAPASLEELPGEGSMVIDPNFRGPTGLPHVEGPSTPPPGAP